MRVLDWMLVLVVMLCLLTVCRMWYRMAIMREEINLINEPEFGLLAELDYRISGLEKKTAELDRIRK